MSPKHVTHGADGVARAGGRRHAAVSGMCWICCARAQVQPRHPEPLASMWHLCPVRSAEAPRGAACHTAAAWISLRSERSWCATSTLWRWSLKVGGSCLLRVAYWRAARKTKSPLLDVWVCKFTFLLKKTTKTTKRNFFPLSDTLLAYWNKFSPQELINVLVLLEWVLRGYNSNTAPLCWQHWRGRRNECSCLPGCTWSYAALEVSGQGTMSWSSSPWEAGVYGGSRVKWQFPVLSAGCAEGVPPPTAEPGTQRSTASTPLVERVGGRHGCTAGFRNQGYEV